MRLGRPLPCSLRLVSSRCSSMASRALMCSNSGVFDIFAPRREHGRDLLLGALDAVGRGRMRLKGLGNRARLLLLFRQQLLEHFGKGLRIVSALVHVLHPEIVGLALIPAAEL